MMLRALILLVCWGMLPLGSWAQLVPKKASNRLWGYVKNISSEKFKIEPIYQHASHFAPNGLARVQKGNTWRLINAKGKSAAVGFDSLGWSDEPSEELAQTPFFQNVIGAKQEGKWGWIDPEGTWRKAPEFLKLTRMGQIVVAKTTQGWQLYHPDATVVNSLYYDSLQSLPNGEIAAWKHKAAALLDANGIALTTFQYRTIGSQKDTLWCTQYSSFKLISAEEGLSAGKWYSDSVAWAGEQRVWVLRNSKWALARPDSLLTSFQWDSVTVFHQGVARVANQNFWGALNSEGVLIIPTQYQHLQQDSVTGLMRGVQSKTVSYFSPEGDPIPNKFTPNWLSNQPDARGWYLAKNGEYTGFVNAAFSVKIPFHYATATAFIGDFAAVRKGDFFGIINRQNEWVIRPVVDSLWVLSPSTFVFHDRGRWGTLDAKGIERFVAQIGDTYQPYGKGLLLRRGRAQGFLNEYGRLVVPPRYDSVALHTDSLYLQIMQNDTLLYAHRYRGEIPSTVACAPWTFTGELREGFIPIRWDGKSGFVDAQCRLRISTQYEAVQPFSEGLAGFQLQGQWGFIDRQEQLRVQPRYQAVSPFQQGVAVVTRQGKQGLIDQNGNEILPCVYDSLQRTVWGNWLLWDSGKVGLFSTQEEFLLYPAYEQIQDTPSQGVIVRKGTLYGINRRNGIHIRFPEYSKIRPLGQYYYLITEQPEQLIER